MKDAIDEMKPLRNQVIIVTGGATGIGRGICTALAEKGARIAIVQPQLHQAQQAAEAFPEAQGFSADIRDIAQVDRMTNAVLNAFGKIDGLVNNASITGEAALNTFETLPREQVDCLVDTNLKGTIWCSQSVARVFITTKTPGCIVHVASVGAFAAQQLASVYCATKAAQVSLARSMALELAPHGVRVNAVAPGDIQTEANEHITEQIVEHGGRGAYSRSTPVGRRGTPLEVGQAVSFLFSPHASFITGTTLIVDGGLTAY